MLVGWAPTVRAASSEIFVHWYREETTQFYLLGGGGQNPYFCAPRLWGVCRARVQHSAELYCGMFVVVVVLSPKGHVMVTSCMLCFHCIDSLPVAPIDLERALVHKWDF